VRSSFLLSFFLHAGAAAVLCVTYPGLVLPPRRPATLTQMHLIDAESIPTPTPPVPFDPPPEPVPETLVVEVEPVPDEPEPREEEPIEFVCMDEAIETVQAQRRPRPIRVGRLREPPRETAPAPTPPPPRPQPAAGPPAARVTSAVPQGEQCRPPAYPAVAQRRHLEGRVVVRVRIDVDGHVKAAEIAQSSGHEVLDEAALEAVRTWTFEPAHEGTRAVESFLNVPFRFRLRG